MNNVNIASKRSYHHGNLRAALIEAALRAIAEEGPDAFTLRDVARRAGVSAAAPYRHFRDKEELFAAVAGDCAERLGAMLERAAQNAQGTALDTFRATGIAYVQFVVAHPEHFRALNTPGIAERMPEEARQRWDARNAEQRRALAEAQAAGVIAPMPLDELCLAANALVQGLGHMIVEGQLGDVSKERATELAVAVTAVLGKGLVPRAAGAPAGAAEIPPKPSPRKSSSPESSSLRPFSLSAPLSEGGGAKRPLSSSRKRHR